jgi:endonuclease/exonuclease/phosphatase family metal-dependent hydrolase
LGTAGVDFEFNEPVDFQKHKAKIVIGDFNSQSAQWGYQEMNDNGERVKDWAATNAHSWSETTKVL